MKNKTKKLLPRGTIVYKVLCFDGYALKSACPPDCCDQLYHLGIVNTPKIKGSGMFVFKSKREALDWAGGSLHRVYRCRASGLRWIHARCKITCVELKDVRAFWRKRWTKHAADNTRYAVWLERQMLTCKKLVLLTRVPRV